MLLFIIPLDQNPTMITMKTIAIPRRLREIPDQPQQLYIRGTFPYIEHGIYLAIVGSRTMTEYGKQACSSIIKALKGYPVVIISGLAYGTDTYAHTVALREHVPTIAVPGSGLSNKVLYPQSNRKLAECIIEHGGCLLSEYEPTFKAQRWSFPKRNRIMAGLCDAVIVIQAENRSGTRITARLATEYNRDVFAVPGDITCPYSEGCHRLIQEGAYLVHSAKDIIDYVANEKYSI
jgi:DNA processing protein